MAIPECDWLNWQSAPTDNGDYVTPIDEVKKRYETAEILPERAWLVLNWDAKRLWLKFAVLEWYSSNGDGSNAVAALVFHGEGPSSGLRECRHTYWGESGYIFYPNAAVIMAGLRALEAFFDLD